MEHRRAGGPPWPTSPRAPACPSPLVSIVMRDAPGASAATRERVLARRGRAGLPPRQPRPAAAQQPQPAARRGVRRAARLPRRPGRRALHGGRRAPATSWRSAPSRPAATSARAVASLLQDRCEALILLGPQAPTAYLADLAARMPVVVVARAVRHRGRRRRAHRRRRRARARPSTTSSGSGTPRIAHIDGGRAPGAAERRRGYRDALHRHGLDRRRADRARRPHRGRRRRGRPRPARRCTPRPDRGHRVQRPLRHRRARRPARRRASTCPATCRVVGFDDSRLARLSHVDLTTIAQDAADDDQPRRRPRGRPARRRVRSANASWSSRPTSSSAARPHRPPARHRGDVASDRWDPSGQAPPYHGRPRHGGAHTACGDIERAERLSPIRAGWSFQQATCRDGDRVLTGRSVHASTRPGAYGRTPRG